MLERFLKSHGVKGNWIPLALTGFVLVLVVLLTFRLHYANKKEVLSRFKDHQFLHAQNIAKQIESLLTSHSASLQTLSSLLSFHKGDMEQKKTAIQVYQKQLEEFHVEAISLHNEFGEKVYSVHRSIIGIEEDRSELMTWAKNGENRGKVFAWTLLPGEEEQQNRGSAESHEPTPLRILLATPLYQDTDRFRTKARFSGLLTFTVDLTEFLEDQLGFVDPKMNLHQVWIIDKSGTLLLESEHQEMVPRSIYRRDESCSRCHLSFDYVETILRKGEGTGDYQLKNFPKKFAAFAPMEFESVSWVVVVNSTHDDLMAYSRKDLKGHLVLLGVVSLAFIVSSIFIIRNDRMIVKAEEEAKHWREKRSLEEKIRQSEILYRTIVETAHDLIWILDDDGRFTFVNKRAEAVLDYKVSELMGKEIVPFIHPEDLRNLGIRSFKTLQGEPQHSEFRFLGKGGKVFILSVNTASLDDGNGVKGTVSFGVDITEEKQAEMALKKSEKQLRYLSSQLLTAQDTERRRISRELHDELGGALAVLKLRLSLIGKDLHQDQTRLREECHQTLSYVDQIIENVRRLIKDLSPPILEDLGLTAAIRSLISNFTKNYDINVKSGLAEVDHLFSTKARIIVYRVIQEALNNIGKHSGAKQVTFTIEKDNGTVSFWVEDDGKGFDIRQVGSKNPSEKGLGLATMNERARMLGGSVHLWSEEGKGTRLCLRVPSIGEESTSESLPDVTGP